MGAQIPMSSEMPDAVFNSIRHTLSALLKKNPKAHADFETSKAAAESALDKNHLEEISDETWEFLIKCAASDADRDVWFDRNDLPQWKPKSKPLTEKDQVKWFAYGFIAASIAWLTN